MDKKDIFSIPEQDYKIHAEPVSIYDDFIDSIYARAQAYFSGKLHKHIADIRDIPESDLLEFLSHFEIVSHIFMFKGLEALRSGDPALAGRMFEDSIKILPGTTKLPDVYFYLAFLQFLYKWPEEKIQQTITKLFEQDPRVMEKFEALWQRLGPEIATDKIKEQFQKTLAERKI